jgi:integrase/recombinase XerD
MSAKRRSTGMHNLKKRGEVWWFRKQVAGTEVEQSLETGDLGLAKDRRDSLLQELKDQGPGRFRDNRRRTFNQALIRFADEHYKTIKPKSRKRYTTSAASLLEVLDGVMLADIKSAKLVEFAEHRRQQGVTGSTIRRDLACLSVIFSKAVAWEWVTHNPVKPFLFDQSTSGLREGPPRTRYLSHEEETEILAHAPPKAALAIMFAIDTGMRKEEQFALEWENIDLGAREAFVHGATSKNSKDRCVPLLPRSLELLRRLQRVHGLRSPHVFITGKGDRYSPSSPTMWEALQTAVRRANKTREAEGRKPMEPVEWHDLRRTCGCRLLQDMQFLMEEVAKWLGHSSVKVTERHYAFLGKAELHRAVERARQRAIADRSAAKSGQLSGQTLMRIRRRA